MEDLISLSKRRTMEAMEHFLCVLSFVPEDKLTWRPSPTAKSALQIAAHCAGYSAAYAGILRTGVFPPIEEFLGPIQTATESVTTLDEAEAVMRKGTLETIAALDSVDPEQISAVLDTPIGRTPFTFFMDIPARHLFAHTAQIDYLQTCWGDAVVHF